MLLHSAGCLPDSRDPLVVATSWPAAARQKLQADFDRWQVARPDRIGDRGVRLQWLALAPGDDPLKLGFGAAPPAVILGGPASTFELLSSADRLSPIEVAGSSRWCTVARPAEGGPPAPTASGVLSDPRRDHESLCRAIAQLSNPGWREGYARLVRAAAGQGASPEGRRIRA